MATMMQIVYKLDLINQIRSVGRIYDLQIRHEYKSSFQFLIFSLKALKDDVFLMFSEIRFHTCGSVYVIVLVANLTVFYVVEVETETFGGCKEFL